jgi:hypothetical protein
MRFSLALLLLSVPAALLAGTDVSFPGAAACALCHSKIPPPGNEQAASVAPFALWRGSMMAHSSRDPFWKAKVRDEAALTPAAKAVIEDKCLRCHAPTQQYLARNGRGMSLRDLEPEGDGVACSVCHQISRLNLGSPASFTGGFEINRDAEIYGPHKDPFRMPMQHHTGLTPVESAHILESSLCGTCHTVITPTLASDGRVTGQLLEQAPYLEWLASDYPKAGTGCQQCHVPALRDASGALAAQYIAHMPPGRWFPPTRPRTPFGLHFFAGGNSPMLNLLAGVEPENEAALHRVAAKAEENLRSALGLTASAVRDQGRIILTVDVRNRTGHKLPTGFPSRRVWLHVEALTADGSPLFESGGWDRHSGAIRAASGVEPHRSVIARPEQAMIYQAVTGDAAGRPTTSLLRAASYLKDNRILPVGFDSAREPRVAPVGTSQDLGFRPGSHRVRYEITLPPGASPARIRVQALYQSIDPAYVPSAALGSLSPAMAPVPMASVEVSLTAAK